MVERSGSEGTFGESPPVTEQELAGEDISEQLRLFLGRSMEHREFRELLDDLEEESTVTATLALGDLLGEQARQWLKAFVELAPAGQTRTVTVQVTQSDLELRPQALEEIRAFPQIRVERIEAVSQTQLDQALLGALGYQLERAVTRHLGTNKDELLRLLFDRRVKDTVRSVSFSLRWREHPLHRRNMDWLKEHVVRQQELLPSVTITVIGSESDRTEAEAICPSDQWPFVWQLESGTE